MVIENINESIANKNRKVSDMIFKIIEAAHETILKRQKKSFSQRNSNLKVGEVEL